MVRTSPYYVENAMPYWREGQMVTASDNNHHEEIKKLWGDYLGLHISDMERAAKTWLDRRIGDPTERIWDELQAAIAEAKEEDDIYLG